MALLAAVCGINHVCTHPALCCSVTLTTEVLQRRLLERLAALAASVLGGHVPVAVVALDAVGRLLEVLGEVPAEVRAPGCPCAHACVKMRITGSRCRHVHQDVFSIIFQDDSDHFLAAMSMHGKGPFNLPLHIPMTAVTLSWIAPGVCR